MYFSMNKRYRLNIYGLLLHSNTIVSSAISFLLVVPRVGRGLLESVRLGNRDPDGVKVPLALLVLVVPLQVLRLHRLVPHMLQIDQV